MVAVSGKGKIDALGRSEMIYQPRLNDLVAVNERAGQLRFSTELAPAVKDAEAVFVAVGFSRRGATVMPISPSSTTRPPRSGLLQSDEGPRKEGNRCRASRSCPMFHRNL
jgi:hypothetical protein